MSIDWAAVSAARNVASDGGPRVVYLVKGSCYYSAAEEHVFWCGPADRIGSGLQINEPGTSTLRQWEARAIGLKTSEEMPGPLHNGIIAGALDLDIACGGDESDDVYTMAGPSGGQWKGWPVKVWAYDTETDGYEEVFSGKWDRNPSGSRDSFSATATATPGSIGNAVPGTTLNKAGWVKQTGWTSGTWTAGNADGPWYPPGPWGIMSGNEGYNLHPDLKDTWFGPVWGESADGWKNHTLSTSVGGGTEMNGVWRELPIYGRSVDASGSWYYAHVSPIGNTTDGGCFVWDIVLRGPEGDDTSNPENEYTQSQTLGTAEMTTFINTDPTAGPTGTNVRFEIPTAGEWETGTTAGERNIGQYEGPRMRCFALVSGHYKADVGGTGWNASTNPFLNTIAGNGHDPQTAGFAPESAQTPIRDYGDILSELLTDTNFIIDPPNVGTNAITDFVTDAPLSTNKFKRRVCALDPGFLPEAPTSDEVVGDLLKSLNAALVQKWDSTANVRAWYPVWRRPFSTDTASDATPIRAGWLRSQDPPSFQWQDDPRREFATKTSSTPAKAMRSPANNDSGYLETFLYANRILDSDSGAKAAHNDADVVSKRSYRWFRHFDISSGDVSADGAYEWADANLSEAAQRQTYVDAELGPRAIGTYLGDLIRYVDIDRMPTAIGQVRGREIDWDALTVLLTTWHGTITYT